jgi:hypothetical protein
VSEIKALIRVIVSAITSGGRLGPYDEERDGSQFTAFLDISLGLKVAKGRPGKYTLAQKKLATPKPEQSRILPGIQN